MRVLSKTVLMVAVGQTLGGKIQKSGESWLPSAGTLGRRAAACGLGFLAACQGATAAAKTDPTAQNVAVKDFGLHDLTAKWVGQQGELERILNDEKEMEHRFERFMQDKYGPICDTHPCRDYALPRPAVNEPRYTTFVENVRKAHDRNLQAAARAHEKGSQHPHVVHGITPLMDLNREEFHSMLGLKLPSKGPELQALKDSFDEDISSKECKSKKCQLGESKDWRDEGAITDVKDQGQCGSCWAFSAVETVESSAIIQGLADQDDPFVGAPQELVSCEKEDNGCHGGLPIDAFKWLKHKGLESEDDYPYRSGDSQKTGYCKADPSLGKYEVTTSKLISQDETGEEGSMTDFILEKGPMSIGVAANDNWQTYFGGVLSLDDCPADEANHAVQAVALSKGGDDPFGDGSYWVVRNSWAAGWGEDGFIRLAYGDNVCNIATMAATAEVKKVDDSKTSSSSVGHSSSSSSSSADHFMDVRV